MASAPTSRQDPPRPSAEPHALPDPFWPLPSRADSSTPTTSQPLQPPTQGYQAATSHAGTTMSQPPVPARKSRRFAPMIRRQCSHMKAIKTRTGNMTCWHCNRVSPLGWLYACADDDDVLENKPFLKLDTILEDAPVAKSSNPLDNKAEEAEHLGLKPDVVKGIRAGQYTMDQIETLLEQKRHVIRTINRDEAEIMKLGQLELDYKSPVAQSIANCGTPSSAANPSKEKLLIIGNSAMKCNFRICWHCRKDLDDRSSYNFEAAYHDEIEPIVHAEDEGLPVHDATIIRNINYKRAPTKVANMDSVLGRQEILGHEAYHTEDKISDDWTPSSDNRMDGFSDAELFPCPGRGICPMWNDQYGCPYDNGFDDGRRATVHSDAALQQHHNVTPTSSRSDLDHIVGESGVYFKSSPGSTESSISLPTPATMQATPRIFADGTVAPPGMRRPKGAISKAKSFDGPFGMTGKKLVGKASHSSLGDEVPVEGGVALTEQAVETGMPDIAH